MDEEEEGEEGEETEELRLARKRLHFSGWRARAGFELVVAGV